MKTFNSNKNFGRAVRENLFVTEIENLQIQIDELTAKLETKTDTKKTTAKVDEEKETK